MSEINPCSNAGGDSLWVKLPLTMDVKWEPLVKCELDGKIRMIIHNQNKCLPVQLRERALLNIA